MRVFTDRHRATTILPGAPDTAGYLAGPVRADAAGYLSCWYPGARCGVDGHGLYLFTVVNTQYGAGRLIEPDFASGFAAILESLK